MRGDKVGSVRNRVVKETGIQVNIEVHFVLESVISNRRILGRIKVPFFLPSIRTLVTILS